MFLVFPALLALSLIGVFRIGMNYFAVFIPLGFAVCFVPAMLLKLNIPEERIKHLSIFSCGVVILALSSNRDVGIYITYILMPLLATMYFDRRLTVKISVLGYFLMAAGLALRTPGMVELEAGTWSGTMADWYIARLIGYTIEYIVTAVFLISLASRAKKLLEDLKSSIEANAAEQAEKERIQTELNIAAQIQAGMLPCIFPPFPDRAEFDIFADMHPAREVGGDFYDFFFTDEKTLAVVMADVSDKGVPAAMFMVIARTLIKNNAQSGKNPKEVFETVNNMLYENNEAGMFVTAFMGYLDITDGRFTFVNAGHNPPLLRKGREFVKLVKKHGFVLAGAEKTPYIQHEISLTPGDALLLYTDGVTEAANGKKEMFGEARLLETANTYRDLPLKEFIASIKREIERFSDGAEQADDITMLALRYKQGEKV
jgi:serine phosphatase RsbU (regulator of sigma subunit)